MKSLLFLAEQTANLLPKRIKANAPKKRRFPTLDQEIEQFYAEIKAANSLKGAKNEQCDQRKSMRWEKIRNQRTPTFSSEEIDMSLKDSPAQEPTNVNSKKYPKRSRS